MAVELILGLGLVVAVGGVGILGTAFWIWMLVDCARNEPAAGNDRIAWILIIALTHLVGALLYFFIRRPERMRERKG